MKARSVTLVALFALLASAAAVTGFAATLGVDSGTIDTFSSDQAGTTTTTTAAPAGTTLYLKTSTPGNVTSSTELPLSTTVPTQSTLPNYDTNRDAFAGLLVQKGQSQRWVTTGPFTTGEGSITFWSQMKDGSNDKAGSVRVLVRACNSGLNGCATMADSTLTSAGAWHSSNSVWVQKTITFSSFGNHNLENDQRRLVVDVFVQSNSGDDMWFAYDTTGYPSALVLE